MRLKFMLPVIFSLAGTAYADPKASVSLDDLVKFSDLEQVKLSPDGRYFAATVPVKDQEVILAIFDTAKRTVLKTIGVRGPGEMVDRFEWVSDERVVMSIAVRQGGLLEQPAQTGELWAVNADGSDFKVLNSWRGEQQTGTMIKKATSQSTFAFLLDDLPDDDDHILATIEPIDQSADGAFPTVVKLNVRSGTRSAVARAPMRSASFLVDSTGTARIAYGVTDDHLTKVYVRAKGSDWSLLLDQAKGGNADYPLSFDGDDQHIVVQRKFEHGPDALYRVSLADGTATELFRDPVSSPMEVMSTADGRSVYAASVDAGVPEYRAIGDSAEAKLLTKLKAAFKGSTVRIASLTRDGKIALVEVTSGNNSGDFYLFDRAKGTADYLVARQQALDPEALALVQPIEVKARDGLLLHGYLTVPRGKSAKNLPLVVWVHGGPHGPRDSGDYDGDAQIFAREGFAVLKINYRGSGGYGRDFEVAGYGQWGATMQDDVTDATRWAIEQGIADPKRICIGGASYGGYAAMVGATREPDLYRCAITYVGVTDLRLMFSRGDIEDSRFGLNYLKRVLGGDRDKLYQRSPVAHLDALKAPVFIAAGGGDQRVPDAHAKALRKGLDASGKPYEFLLKATEGHGYFDMENRKELYTKMVAFLHKHLDEA